MLMQITNNLNQDIENAPQWFKDAVELRPVDKIIEHPLGDISYSKWSSSVDTKNLIVLIHGTGAHKKWWDPIAPQFLNYSNVVAIDLPGMGESGFRKKYGIKDFGECITSVIEKEIEIAKDQLRAEGKPEAMLDNIAKGKIKRFFKDNTLVNQAFIKDSKQSVAAYVKTIGDVNVTGFKRVALG